MYDSAGRYNERAHIELVFATLGVEGHFVDLDAVRWISLEMWLRAFS